MNKIGNIICISMCGFLFTTTTHAQSFLKKTLKVLETVNDVNKAVNSDKKTAIETEEKSQTDNNKTVTKNKLYIGSAYTDNSSPINPQKTNKTKIIYIENKTILCTEYFKDGVCLACHPQKGWGVFDTTGTQIIDYKLHFGTIVGNSQMPEFENGYCPVRDPKGSYIINKQGKIVSQFTNIINLSNFQQGIATATQTMPDPKNKHVNIRRVVYVNNKGELIFPHLYFTVKWENSKPMRPFNDGLSAYYDYDQKLWGFIDHTGNTVVKAQYKMVQDFHDGYAAVLTTNDKWGFIDTNGTFQIPAMYAREPMPFSEGVALVSRREGPSCLIDKTGKIVLDFIYKMTPFYNNKAFVNFSQESPYREIDPNHNFIFIIDREFKVVGLSKKMPLFIDNYNEEHWPSNNLWLSEEGVLMDNKGDAIYASNIIRPFSNNRSYVCFDDGKSALTAGFMNPSGEIVFLFTQSEF